MNIKIKKCNECPFVDMGRSYDCFLNSDLNVQDECEDDTMNSDCPLKSDSAFIYADEWKDDK